MRRWLVAVLVEVDLFVLALVGAVFSARAGVRTTDFPPSGDAPGFTAVRYVAPWWLLATVLVAVAGVLAIDVVARLARRPLAAGTAR
ncbi:hypothetical protein [Nocardia implantans]|uniref:Uncharacterized protein n=1 Tax=Nocardia implantans TaxID=3108168 RepID=A0ABU6B409_9NOCA|nr:MULTISPECIES: hypothetical protein [unclassified Nocardia]MBF6196087.1 hypothetical protein [Nocardia beijingensis]MEA3532536.1 hypothetical protein [Nocardia sp. CDC192]MEB3514431.1 hypothetical protein [Nocardia sp. CDC186]